MHGEVCSLLLLSRNDTAEFHLLVGICLVMSVATNNEAPGSQSAEGADEEQRRLVAERAQVRLAGAGHALGLGLGLGLRLRLGLGLGLGLGLRAAGHEGVALT